MTTMRLLSSVTSLLWLMWVVKTTTGFSVQSSLSDTPTQKSCQMLPSDNGLEEETSNQHGVIDRRRCWQQLLSTAVVLPAVSIGFPVVAEEPVVALPEMKSFVDPLFLITIPKSYFALRRSAKGDLPDANTGQGRRGSSIFTAGDMSKAEVVAIERFPTRILLEENGIEPTGDLSTFPRLGDAAAIANLLLLRRERDKPGQSLSRLVPGSVTVSNDGKILSFQLRTEIEVQKPELLLEQSGVSELFRMTDAKASLESNDGNLMAVFASALEQDYKGPDGVALRQVVDSFVALDQSKSSS